MSAARLSSERRFVLLASSSHQFVGSVERNKDKERLGFTYSQQWLNFSRNFPLSPRVPLNVGSGGRGVDSYLANILPEGCALQDAATHYQVSLSNTIALTMYLCREPAGAVGYQLEANEAKLPDGEEPFSREISGSELSARIRSRGTVPFSVWDGKYYQSLAGVHDKLQVVLSSGRISLVSGSLNSTHILKPEPRSAFMPCLVANEHYCMSLAAALGLSTAKVDIMRVPEPILLVERFDRVENADKGGIFRTGAVERTHIIDGCQALGKNGWWKYECPDSDERSIRSIRKGIGFRALFDLRPHFMAPEKAVAAIVKWALFNLLIGNSDAHAKNISFFQYKLSITPAPAYDLVSTRVYEVMPEMAMAFGDAFLAEGVANTDLEIFAADAGLSLDALVEEIETMAPAAVAYAKELLKAGVYTDEERELLTKIAAFVESQAAHLLKVVAISVSKVRLGPAKDQSMVPNDIDTGNDEIARMFYSGSMLRTSQ